MSASPLEYLRHILDEAEFLSTEAQTRSFDQFIADETVKRAFVRSIEVMGEAAKQLSDDFRHRFPDVDFKRMAGMRDRLIHGYFGVDYELVWDVATRKAKPLCGRLIEIIAAETR